MPNLFALELGNEPECKYSPLYLTSISVRTHWGAVLRYRRSLLFLDSLCQQLAYYPGRTNVESRHRCSQRESMVLHVLHIGEYPMRIAIFRDSVREHSAYGPQLTDALILPSFSSMMRISFNLFFRVRSSEHAPSSHTSTMIGGYVWILHAKKVGDIFQGAVYLSWSAGGLLTRIGSDGARFLKSISRHSYPQSACGGAATNLPSLMSHS